IDHNVNILEIEIRDTGGRDVIKTGYSSGKKIPSDSYFVIERNIYDALGIQKLALVKIYYSKADFISAKLFVAKTLFLLFILALVLGFFGLIKINSFFAPLRNLTEKLSDFNPEHPSFKLPISPKKDEISIVQNTIAVTMEKLVSYQQKIIQANETLEDAVRERTKELNEQIELFRVLTDASPNALILFDTNLIYANPAFSKLTGYEPVEFFKKKIDTLFELDEDSELAQALDATNPKNRRYPQRFDEVELRRKDGSKCYVSASIAYLRIKERDAAIINLTDLTALKQKDQMLLLQSRFVAMGEMIGNIAHQWRQPLNIIQSAITKISVYKEMGLITNEFLDETVNSVKRQVSYLSATIDDFRSFYKDDPGGSFLLVDAIKKSLSLVEAVYHNHFIEVEVLCDACEDVKLKGSMNRLIQALLNILNNSKDAIILTNSEFKKVKIQCGIKQNMVVVSIQDSGGGIDPKNISKIFDPYFSTKNKSQGTGIGLYMTKQIISGSFGGKIEAKNAEMEIGDQKVKGALFQIEIERET
ncbi:MAG: PAS domain S-box protein, partial [Campylobacteraceae bacterium]|nr:PAS domain S-box protein [Campylobacteraceae bacterium]